MSKTTVIALAGKRIDVRPSPTSPGCVLIQILSADRAVQASVTLTSDAASVFESGIGYAARAAAPDQAGETTAARVTA